MAHAKPTDGELAILRILWERGPSTVKEIHRVLAEGRELPYTTVLSAMQVMHDKHLVGRDTSTRQHVYAAVLGENEARTSLVDDLVDKAFRGSALDLMVHALASGRASMADLEALRKLIAERKKGASQ